MGTRCSCGAGHATFGACVRAKGLQIGRLDGGRERGKAWDAELQAYRDAKAQGIRPDSTRLPDIRRAVEISDRTGVAYGAFPSG